MTDAFDGGEIYWQATVSVDDGMSVQALRQRLMQVLAGVFAIGGCASAVKGWRDREQDRALLRGAPVSAWGRGARYR